MNLVVDLDRSNSHVPASSRTSQDDFRNKNLIPSQTYFNASTEHYRISSKRSYRSESPEKTEIKSLAANPVAEYLARFPPPRVILLMTHGAFVMTIFHILSLRVE
ncbi:hypothetical protein TMatcc_001044 [Talaromyces marneffei ATCC 18224]